MGHIDVAHRVPVFFVFLLGVDCPVLQVCTPSRALMLLLLCSLCALHV